MTDLEIWDEAVELNYAFFGFSDSFQREKFQNAKSEGASQTLKILMFADLFANLASGAFEAFGFRIDSNFGNSPERIPAHCFMLRPNIDQCEADIIEASGWRYERVRVVNSNGAVTAQVTTNKSLNPGKSASGRPSTYAAAREALLALQVSDPNIIKRPASRLIDDFNAAYLMQVDAFGLPKVGLSDRVLRDHLIRFRQELAETGNNKPAN